MPFAQEQHFFKAQQRGIVGARNANLNLDRSRYPALAVRDGHIERIGNVLPSMESLHIIAGIVEAVGIVALAIQKQRAICALGHHAASGILGVADRERQVCRASIVLHLDQIAHPA